jgi:type IV pilus assembly protein PilQ
LTFELKRDARLETSVKNDFVSIKVIPSELVKPEIRVEKFSEGELVKINLKKKPKNVTYRKVSNGFLITLSGLKLEKFSLVPESQIVKRVETLDVPEKNVIKVTIAKFNSAEITHRDKEVVIKVFELPESRETKSEINSKDIKNMTVSLKFSNADVRTVIKAITDVVGVNVVFDPEVKGTVNVNFKKPVFWKKALEAVLEPLGFTYVETEDYLRILPKSKIITERRLEPPNFYVVRLNYAEVSKVKKEIEELVFKYSKTAETKDGTYRETVTIDKSNNALLLKVTPSHYEEIMKIIKRIDRPIKQVMIKAKIVVLDSNVADEFGASWFISGYNNLPSGSHIAGSYGFSTQSLPFSSVIPDTIGTIPSVSSATLSFGILNPSQTLKTELAIKALENEGKGQTISNPKVLVFDNEQAQIEQGVEIPYKTTTTSSQGVTETAYEFKKAVLMLRVKPHITNDNHVIMDIEIRKDTTTNIEGVEEPGINTRSIRSKVRIVNGSTIVIGGIYEKTRDYTKSSVPVLSEIPLLGWLFKYEKTTVTNKKLLIFITPQIVD